MGLPWIRTALAGASWYLCLPPCSPGKLSCGCREGHEVPPEDIRPGKGSLAVKSASHEPFQHIVLWLQGATWTSSRGQLHWQRQPRS